MTRFLFTVFIILTFPLTTAGQSAPDPLKREYHGFTLWLDCKTHHGALAFYYEIGKDAGNIDRSGYSFEMDREVPPACQATRSESYRTNTVPPSAGKWDRGHLVPANHLDNDPAAPALRAQLRSP